MTIRQTNSNLAHLCILKELQEIFTQLTEAGAGAVGKTKSQEFTPEKELENSLGWSTFSG